jgi:hypothetical protein
MKKNIMLLFVILLAVMFLSTPVMAKSKKSDKKSWYSYVVLKSKIKMLERKLRSKIKEIKKLQNKARKLSSQKRGPRGLQGEPGPQGPQGLAVCPGCWFPGDVPPTEVLERLEGAYLPHAYMSGIDLSGAYLIGADLRGASITWADLSGADLSGVNFSPMPWVNYKGVPSLFNANLTGTDMTGVTLDGVIWDNTICPDGTNSDNNGGTCEDNLEPLKP